MAIATNDQIAAMTPVQFVALPLYLNLQHSAKMLNKFLMNLAVS